MITFAPERPGATGAIVRVVASGAVAAISHTEATYEQTCAAISSGATVATHLFNAMPSIHHRAPGPIVALLDDPRVMVELICDGVHLDPVRHRRAAQRRPAAHFADHRRDGRSRNARRRLRFGGLSVDVIDRVARVARLKPLPEHRHHGSGLDIPLHSGLSEDAAVALAVQQTSINTARRWSLPSRTAGRRTGNLVVSMHSWGSKRCCTTVVGLVLGD